MDTSEHKEWFAEWFDTPYYHTLYKHRDFSEAERFITNLLNYLDLPKEAKCLDLACGKGRHSIFLNKKGYDVTGVDLSANSIEEAKAFENDSLRFDVHDMREVYREDAYDAIFNLFTSFGYFDDDAQNEQVIESMCKMLKQDGVLVIDFMNAHKTINNLVANEVKEIDGITFEINRTYDGTHIYKDIAFQDDGHSFNFQERVQALKKERFLELFDKVGLKVKDTFGNFSLDPFDADTSDRLIFICEK